MDSSELLNFIDNISFKNCKNENINENNSPKNSEIFISDNNLISHNNLINDDNQIILEEKINNEKEILINETNIEINIDSVSEEIMIVEESIIDNGNIIMESEASCGVSVEWAHCGRLCYRAANPCEKVTNNHLRGCLWSPDGTCLLSNSNDNVLRVYELPRAGYNKDLYHAEHKIDELNPVLSMKEIDLIYDYCWYPFMNSNKPDTCLLASTSRKGSVRLWDAYYGIERGRIQPYDHLVEPISAQSIAFSRDGVKLYCGFDKCVRVFDITRLSNSSERRPTLGNKSELRGIISCIATSAVNIGMYACGSYSKDAAIFHEQSGERILEFLRTDDRIGGITHMEFSPVDMNCVVTGGRIDDALHVWDLRLLGSPIYSIAKRLVRTNQRIYFQFDPTGRYIVSGNHNGNVSVFSIYGQTSETDDFLLPKVMDWNAHNDVCNGLSLHPSLPLLATASGQRRLTVPWKRSGMLKSCEAGSGEDSDWSSDDDNVTDSQQNEIRIWSLPVIVEKEND